MDDSVRLLCVVSPKITRKHNFIRKGRNSILALRHSFRRSSTFDKSAKSVNNEELNLVESSSTESYYSSKDDEKVNEIINETPIVISDSESSPMSEKEKSVETNVPSDNCAMPNKFKEIQDWIDKIEHDDFKDTSGDFSELSTIQGDSSTSRFLAKEKGDAVNSTFIGENLKKINECFNKASPDVIEESFEKSLTVERAENYMTPKNQRTSPPDILECSLDSVDLLIQKRLKDTITVRKKRIFKNNSECDMYSDDVAEVVDKENKDSNAKSTPDSYIESILDDCYGEKWREKEDLVLPKSEKKPKNKCAKPSPQKSKTEKKPKTSPLYKNPYLEEEMLRSDNLRTNLLKARTKLFHESSLIERIKKLCDSDSSDCEIYEVGKKDEPVKKGEAVKKDSKKDKPVKEKEKEVSIPKKRITSKKKWTIKKKFVISDDSDDSDEENEKWEKEISRIVYDKKSLPREDTFTFLQSLSGSVPIFKCDPSARVFRNDYKNRKDELIEKLAKIYNEKVFGNKLLDVKYEWNNRLLGTAGFCKCKKITRSTGAVERTATIMLATKVIDSPDRLRDTLIHEMCHAATWLIDFVSDGHGPYWKSWALKAMKTFPELPSIKRCHDYALNHKYTYKCIGCSYSFGRHKKSLDIERKRCGYCFGKFEVFLNKTSKNGETKSVATPKKPATGFALFVKENYGKYRSPDVKHGDVMKLLGQKFQEMKVNK